MLHKLRLMLSSAGLEAGSLTQQFVTPQFESQAIDQSSNDSVLISLYKA
jgi:hypothetical protein